jgi:hypothetical protein
VTAFALSRFILPDLTTLTAHRRSREGAEQICKQRPIGITDEKRRQLCRKPLPQIALIAGITIVILRQALQHKRTEQYLASCRLRPLLPVQSRLQTALALFELFDALRDRLSHDGVLL